MLFGIDVSAYQTGIDMHAVAAEGFTFALVKATEGADYTSPAFLDQYNAARDAGMITIAYHYQRDGDPAGQVERIRKTVPAGVPVAIDVEQGSGDLTTTRPLIDGLHAAGYAVPLTYLPQWYWRQIGEPDLTGLPPLWSSRYPSTRPAPASVLYGDVPADYWTGYGGLPVAVLQFADSAQVAGHLLDASAFGGEIAELAAVLFGAPAPAPAPPEDDDAVATVMLPATPAPAEPGSPPETWDHWDFTIPLAPPGGWHGDVMAHVVVGPYYPHDAKVAGHVRYANWFVEPDPGGDDVHPVAVADHVNDLGAPMVRFWSAHWGPAPARTSALVLNLACPGGAAVTLEYQR